MSPKAKSVDASLSVKVRVATSPTLRAVSLVVMVTVGATVSSVKLKGDDVVEFPAASVTLTNTLLMPSFVKENSVPVKGLNVLPLSVE